MCWVLLACTPLLLPLQAMLLAKTVQLALTSLAPLQACAPHVPLALSPLLLQQRQLACAQCATGAYTAKRLDHSCCPTGTSACDAQESSNFLSSYMQWTMTKAPSLTLLAM